MNGRASMCIRHTSVVVQLDIWSVHRLKPPAWPADKSCVSGSAARGHASRTHRKHWTSRTAHFDPWPQKLCAAASACCGTCCRRHSQARAGCHEPRQVASAKEASAWQHTVLSLGKDCYVDRAACLLAAGLRWRGSLHTVLQCRMQRACRHGKSFLTASHRLGEAAVPLSNSAGGLPALVDQRAVLPDTAHVPCQIVLAAGPGMSSEAPSEGGPGKDKGTRSEGQG